MAKDKKLEKVSANTDYVIRLLEPIQFIEGGRILPIGAIITVLAEKGKELIELKQAEKL